VTTSRLTRGLVGRFVAGTTLQEAVAVTRELQARRPAQHDVASKLDAGTVWVNAHLVLANEGPWGGFKGSGYGRDLSIYALDDYSRTKHVMHSVAR
jgi:acyl-CoA reductase-like NAD-dependent aldehyde dehydrogenase